MEKGYIFQIAHLDQQTTQIRWMRCRLCLYLLGTISYGCWGRKVVAHFKNTWFSECMDRACMCAIFIPTTKFYANTYLILLCPWGTTIFQVSPCDICWIPVLYILYGTPWKCTVCIIKVRKNDIIHPPYSIHFCIVAISCVSYNTSGVLYDSPDTPCNLQYEMKITFYVIFFHKKSSFSFYKQS